MKRLMLLLGLLSIASVLAQAPARAPALTLTSPDFETNQSIPSEFTCSGKDINPNLVFGHVPAKTKSLALIVDDIDAPKGSWIHWLVFDMDPNTRGIRANSVPGTQGENSWGKAEWRGPCPPSGVHRYVFRLLALDTKLDLPPGADLAAVHRKANGHVLAQATLIGLYAK